MPDSRARRFLRAGFAAALTLFVLWKSEPRAVASAAAAADWRFIGLAVLAVVIDRLLMAYRWLVLLCAIAPEARPRLGVILRIFFVSTFFGTFLPTSVGGDAVRAYSLSRQNVPGADALASVVMDRVLGVVSILLLGVAGLFISRDLADSPAVIAALLVTTAGCVFAVLMVFSPRVAQLGNQLLAHLPWRRIERGGQKLIQAVQRYAEYQPQLANVLVGSILVQVLRVLEAYLLGRALGIAAGPAVYFALIPIILLVMLLPITAYGIGTSQAAFVLFFGRAGVPNAEAFTLSVLFLALGIVGNLPGGLLAVWDQFYQADEKTPA